MMGLGMRILNEFKERFKRERVERGKEIAFVIFVSPPSLPQGLGGLRALRAPTTQFGYWGLRGEAGLDLGFSPC